MTIRIITLTGALLAAAFAPSLAQEAALAPHELNFDRQVEPDNIVIQDLSGGVGSQDSGGNAGNVIQIMQISPSSTGGVSTSTSAPRYVGTATAHR